MFLCLLLYCRMCISLFFICFMLRVSFVLCMYHKLNIHLYANSTTFINHLDIKNYSSENAFTND